MWMDTQVHGLIGASTPPSSGMVAESNYIWCNPLLHLSCMYPMHTLSVFQVVMKEIPVWVGLESLLSSLPL